MKHTHTENISLLTFLILIILSVHLCKRSLLKMSFHGNRIQNVPYLLCFNMHSWCTWFWLFRVFVIFKYKIALPLLWLLQFNDNLVDFFMKCFQLFYCLCSRFCFYFFSILCTICAIKLKYTSVLLQGDQSTSIFCHQGHSTGCFEALRI